MNIETELLILQTNLEALHKRVEEEIEKYRKDLFQIEDEILALMDKRAVLLAAKQGIEIGTVLVATRPLVWQGRLASGLRIKVTQISTSFGPNLWQGYGQVAIKSGWSKRDIAFDPSWCEIAGSPTNAND